MRLVCPQIFIYKTANLHMSRPASKRALAAAFINSIGSVAAYWCAYIFVDPPGLHPAFYTRKSRWISPAEDA